jgi:hypothetical protein
LILFVDEGIPNSSLAIRVHPIYIGLDRVIRIPAGSTVNYMAAHRWRTIRIEVEVGVVHRAVPLMLLHVVSA